MAVEFDIGVCLIIGTPSLTVLMQQINTYHCSSAIVVVSLRISEWFFAFFSILYGDQNFPILFWSFYEDSEFLWVFLIGIRISKKNHFSFGVPRRNQKFYAELLMEIRISELLFGLLYGDQNFWIFFGLLYGDQNFWKFFELLYVD